MVKRFGANSSTNPNAVSTPVQTFYYTPPSPEGAVTAPRPTMSYSVPTQPQSAIFRGRIVYFSR